MKKKMKNIDPEDAFQHVLESAPTNKDKAKERPYGSNIVGTIFHEITSEKDEKFVNFEDLLAGNLLSPDTILKEYAGINGTMLYIGYPLAVFGIHCEDEHMLSINFLADGHPKLWVFISYKDLNKVMDVIQMHGLPRRECDNKMNHKRSLLSFELLEDLGVDYRTFLQLKGDFIITLTPHMGMATGYHMSTAQNFVDQKYVSQVREDKIDWTKCSCSLQANGGPNHDVMRDHLKNEELKFNRNYRFRSCNGMSFEDLIEPAAYAIQVDGEKDLVVFVNGHQIRYRKDGDEVVDGEYLEKFIEDLKNRDCP